MVGINKLHAICTEKLSILSYHGNACVLINFKIFWLVSFFQMP